MSFSLVLNTTSKGTQNTVGIDYTWYHDFSMVDDAAYEMTFCFYSTNVALADFSTLPTPNLCIDLQQPSRSFAPDKTSAQRTSRVIGVLKQVWSSTTVGSYQSDMNSNPPIFFQRIGSNVNSIRQWVSVAGSETAIATSLGAWTSILFFRKIQPERPLSKGGGKAIGYDSD